MRDAYACWSGDTQAWELFTMFDNAHRSDCGGGTSIIKTEVAP